MNLARRGSLNVVTGDLTPEGEFKFKDFPVNVENVRWMDSGEALSSRRDGKDLYINLTGYRYGDYFCVRVAKADIVK